MRAKVAQCGFEAVVPPKKTAKNLGLTIKNGISNAMRSKGITCV